MLRPRSADLFVLRCTALAEMQRLADEAFSREHVSLFPSTKVVAAAAATAREPIDNQASSSPPVSEDNGGEKSSKYPSREPLQKYPQERSRSNDEGEARGRAVAKLLACWRAEVLKQLLQRGAAAEIAAEESRKAARQVREAREERGLAETNVKVPSVCVCVCVQSFRETKNSLWCMRCHFFKCLFFSCLWVAVIRRVKPENFVFAAVVAVYRGMRSVVSLLC